MVKAFSVYLRGKEIDTIFYGDDSTETADDVRRSLINHDGYDSRITVRKERKSRTTESRRFPRT